jgi:hypothetical protein
MTGSDHAAEISTGFRRNALLRLPVLVMRPGDSRNGLIRILPDRGRAPPHRERERAGPLVVGPARSRSRYEAACHLDAEFVWLGLQSGIWLSAQLLLLFRALVPDKSFDILRLLPRRSHAQS